MNIDLKNPKTYLAAATTLLVIFLVGYAVGNIGAKIVQAIGG